MTRVQPATPGSHLTRILLAIGSLVRAVLALAALLTLIVGLPYGLVRFIGWPLPKDVPTWDEVQAVLLAPMTPQFLLDLLACVLWLLWARFTFDVLAAIPDLIRAAEWPHRARRGPLHAFAGVLVSAVVVSILSSRASSHTAAPQTVATEFANGGPTPAVVASYLPKPETAPGQITTATLHTHAVTQRAALTEVVRPPEHGVYDSLWRIAERCLGDGARWPEIWTLNKNVRQVDGRVFTNPNLIQPGWALQLPATTSPAPPVDVQPDPDEPAEQETPGPEGQQETPNSQAPTPEQHAPAEPAAPAPDTHPGISTSTGAFAGIGLAALITIALITVRLHRRRRYRPGVPEAEDPGRAPIVRALRIAHDSIMAPPEEAPITPTPPDATRQPELATRARARDTAQAVLPSPDEVILGVRDEHAVALNVAQSRGLGLIGPGAPAAARALIVTLLARAVAGGEGGEAWVVIPAADAHIMFGPDLPPRSPTRLRIVDTLTTALETIEAELLSRARRADEPSHPGPTPLVLVATPTTDTERRTQAILDNGSAFNMAGIMLGQWRAGETARVREDGTIAAASPNLPDQLADARLFTLPGTDATDLLALLHDADPANGPSLTLDAEEPSEDAQATADDAPPRALSSEPASGEHEGRSTCPDAYEFVLPHATELEPGPQPVTSSPEQEPSSPPTAGNVGQAQTSTLHPPPLHFQVLGRLHLTTRTDAEPVDLISATAPRQREILVYLALHRDGCRRESLTAALWPDAPGDRPYNSFHATLSQLRRALRQASDDATPTLVMNDDGHYRLDPSRVTVDLWQLQDALTARRHAPTSQERAAALRQVADLYRGDLAEEIAAEWIEAARESLRREVLDALSAMIRAVDHDPEQVLMLLEQARRLDPYNEAIYRDLMRVQARLGMHDSIPRTLGLLTTSLAELDQRPTRDTMNLADFLHRATPNRQRNREAS